MSHNERDAFVGAIGCARVCGSDTGMRWDCDWEEKLTGPHAAGVFELIDELREQYRSSGGNTRHGIHELPE